MLRIQNTYSKENEVFHPWNEHTVNMYVCGPTVYDYAHIGHARTFVVFDGIRRYLSLKGYNTIYVQNITDIDDKIINRARELRTSWKEISEVYTKDYLDKIKKLNIKIDLHPKVTDHIREIIEFIERLIDKGFAYVSPRGSVYFDVDKQPSYGRLSGNFNKRLWNQGEEVSEKKNPYDFALWKAAKPGEPFWESPWGRGRPGWHIECSVMSTRYLGRYIDIHGGGSDLIFPHHENEIAQSEAYFGERPWVKYWLHSGMLTVKGEKMSKSLGNIIPLKEALSEWGSETLRLWILSSHYRTIIEYSDQSLSQARKLFDRLSFIAQDLMKRIQKEEYVSYINDRDLATLLSTIDLANKWYGSMDNDFNMGEAVKYLWALTELYYKEVQFSESFALVSYFYKVLYELNRFYGILDKIMLQGFVPSEREISTKLIDLILEVRGQLRENKMYDLADEIRSRLLSLGIKVIDKGNKSEYFFNP
ncbi:MAG: cysteine--tRNA ligase [Caldisphaeraceae archaeon]|nr:cysteine--tRNA ligase [Caldisphaeraceae archaeon]